MTTDLRKNPRFVSLSGVPARLTVAGQVCEGCLQDFSLSGFAVIAAIDEVGKDVPVEVHFADAKKGSEFHLTATVTNSCTADEGKVRLGCQIVALHGMANAYIGFMTQLIGQQGFVASMASKPVNYRQTEADHA